MLGSDSRVKIFTQCSGWVGFGANKTRHVFFRTQTRPDKSSSLRKSWDANLIKKYLIKKMSCVSTLGGKKSRYLSSIAHEFEIYNFV